MKGSRNLNIEKIWGDVLLYRLLDLFAGAGGMSTGFLQTGKFEIAAAVEKDAMASKTYSENHPVDVMKGDICELDFKSLGEELGEIDVIIGGPPCQGFSNTNRQRNRIISINNQLVKKYVEAVMTIKPKAFVMENVGMIRSETHRFFITHNDFEMIKKYNIKLREENIKIGQDRVLADQLDADDLKLERYQKLLFDKAEYDFIRTLYKLSVDNEKFGSYFKEHPKRTKKYTIKLIERFEENIDPISGFIHERLMGIDDYRNNKPSDIGRLNESLKNLINMQKIITELVDLLNNDVDFKLKLDKEKSIISIQVRTYSVLHYIISVLGEIYYMAKDLLNAADYGVPQYRERYILIGVLKEFAKAEDVVLPQGIIKDNKYITIREAIEDLENEPTSFQVSEAGKLRENPPVQMTKYQKYVCNSQVLFNNTITDTQDVAKRRFASLNPGENFHNLSYDLKHETYTNVERTQNTIYKRLDYDTVSGTVLNIRKSMWIHPTINRAVSIREAARLQSFQDSFIFWGKKDDQYQQIGNAVPPLLARAIAEKILELLGDVPETYLSVVLN